ncbi:MAG: hypothetical protein HYU63_01355 [Armatimonadetes bacterium]|nr:hypothetical protein [Armatimonadota bacterium]
MIFYKRLCLLWLFIIFTGRIVLALNFEELLKLFFKYVNFKNYRSAYGLLDNEIKINLDFSRFYLSASAIKYIKLINYKILENESNLCRLQVKTKVVIKQKDNFIKAIYFGRVTLIKNQEGWKIFSVEMKPINYKKLKTLDFGT